MQRGRETITPSSTQWNERKTEAEAVNRLELHRSGREWMSGSLRPVQHLGQLPQRTSSRGLEKTQKSDRNAQKPTTRICCRVSAAAAAAAASSAATVDHCGMEIE